MDFKYSEAQESIAAMTRDFAAKHIERRDRCAPLRWQKQKGVVKTAARGNGFLLDVVLRRHEDIVTSLAVTAGVARAAQWPCYLIHAMSANRWSSCVWRHPG